MTVEVLSVADPDGTLSTKAYSGKYDGTWSGDNVTIHDWRLGRVVITTKDGVRGAMPVSVLVKGDQIVVEH